ncbi:type IV toxin-antitoxin system AbiEi family antitoxin [Marinomonas dokdonensis]|uniref:type IV toxin-antitoxin system AbiEi family antitoxin n=1 Tax=Marinomonas dokdonensis TaxID=328224 RepID=UPI004055922F
MNKQLSLATNALALLPSHIKAEFVEVANEGRQSFADGELCLKVGSETYYFYLAIKNIHRKESLEPLLAHTASNTLLICNRLTPFLAELCVSNKLNFIDTAGNIKITQQGLHLWVEPSIASTKEAYAKETKPVRIGEGAAKVLFALLSQPSLLNCSYREISEHANVSLGMVSKALSLLESEFLISLGKTRRILDEKRMLNLWIDVYYISIRPKLEGVRLECGVNWQGIEVKEGQDFWSGEAAAEQLTQYLHPQELQLYTRLPLQKKLAQLKCLPNYDGNLWLVSAFWGAKLKWSSKSQALLAVAELEASKDSRNMEVARMIYEKYLFTGTPP